MLGKRISRPVAAVLGIAAVCIVLAGYSYLSYKQKQENEFDKTIPSWAEMKEGVAKTIELDRRDERWIVVDSKTTAYRLFLGLGISVLGAIVFGVLMGVLPPVEAMLYPPLSIAAKMVPTAMIAVFFVLFGIEQSAFLAIVIFGIMPTLTQTVALSVEEVHEELLYKAYTLGATHIEVVWNVILPQILPKVIDAVRLAIGPALVYLIAAEMVFADEGFGYRIRLESKKLNMDIVYPYIVFLALFGFVMDFSLRRFNRWVAPWAVSEKR